MTEAILMPGKSLQRQVEVTYPNDGKNDSDEQSRCDQSFQEGAVVVHQSQAEPASAPLGCVLCSRRCGPALIRCLSFNSKQMQTNHTFEQVQVSFEAKYPKPIVQAVAIPLC